MQAMMLLPSLMMSIVWAMRTNDYTIVFMTAALASISAFLGKRRSLKPSGVGQPVHYRRGRIFIGQRRLPRSSKLWLPSWRKTVFEHIQNLPASAGQQEVLDQAISRGLSAASSGRLPSWLGVSGEADFELDLLGSAPHLFVVGPTGSGKSQLIRILLASLNSRFTPRQLMVFVADFKGSALLQDAFEIPSHWQVIDDLEPELHRGFWSALADDIEDCEKTLKLQGRSEFDPHGFDSAMRLLVVDEVAAACRSSQQAAEVISAIAARGRSLGFGLVVANQGMSGVPRELLLNLRTRIALAGTDQVELVQLGGQATKLKQSQPGWVAARVISHAHDDRDFSYPLGLI
jgi:S-DNA-T family DNA segregation ATPase FtsK/SpoIIIE